MSPWSLCSQTGSDFASRWSGNHINCLRGRQAVQDRASCGADGDLMLVVDIVAVIRVPDKLDAQFFTFDPAQPAGQCNVLAGDEYLERLRHISQWNRGKPCARQAHVFQFAEHTTSIVANQQADRTADFVARVGISSVVHSKLIQDSYGAGELKTVHSANEWLPHVQKTRSI